MFNTNNDYAIEVTQCYGQSNLTLCNQYPVRSIPRLSWTSSFSSGISFFFFFFFFFQGNLVTFERPTSVFDCQVC
jgi:hypothetical protein